MSFLILNVSSAINVSRNEAWYFGTKVFRRSVTSAKTACPFSGPNVEDKAAKGKVRMEDEKIGQVLAWLTTWKGINYQQTISMHLAWERHKLVPYVSMLQVWVTLTYPNANINLNVSILNYLVIVKNILGEIIQWRICDNFLI